MDATLFQAIHEAVIADVTTRAGVRLAPDSPDPLEILAARPFSEEDAPYVAKRLASTFANQVQAQNDLAALGQQTERQLQEILTGDDHLVDLIWRWRSPDGGQTEDLTSCVVYSGRRGQVTLDPLAELLAQVEMAPPAPEPTGRRAPRVAAAAAAVPTEVTTGWVPSDLDQAAVRCPNCGFVLEAADRGWYARFRLAEQNGFTGQVLHVHIPDLGAWNVLIDDLLSIVSNLPYVGLAAQIIQINMACARNRDGSYDTFAFNGTRKVGWLDVPFLYVGFVSDDPLLPTVRLSLLQPGIIGIFPIASLITGYYVKHALAAPYRVRPRPADQPVEVEVAYVANRNPTSREVHRSACHWASRIAPEHRVPYIDLREALADGYDGCFACLAAYHRR